MLRLTLVLTGVILFFGLAARPQTPELGATGGRTTLFISDLHFGIGKTADGAWHPFEDFRWTSEFALFLDRIDDCGEGRTDLIVNGDALELWQSPVESECRVRANRNMGCSEEEAVRRLDRVVSAHSSDLTRIGRFARSGENSVVLVPGNHDAGLLFGRVAERVVSATGAPDRVSVATEGYWLSKDKKLYAEHGHQIGRDANKFSSWPDPFREYRGTRRLERSWGEQFVQQFYNRYEERYPLIDNFLGETTGIRYGLAAERLGGALLGSLRFLRFALFDVSGRQFVGSLGARDPEAPRWNVAAIRQSEGDRFVIESLPTSDPLRAEAERAWEAGLVAIRLDDLSDQELLEICDLRQAIVEDDQRMGRQLSVQVCPAVLGAATRILPGVQRRLLRARVEEVRDELVAKGRILADEPFQVFIYSHTHDATPAFKPEEGLWRPVIANTGAWQRLVTAERLKTIQTENRWTDSQVLASVNFDQVPACYPFVVVPPYTTSPQPKLAHWRRSQSGAWEISDTCLQTSPARRCP